MKREIDLKIIKKISISLFVISLFLPITGWSDEFNWGIWGLLFGYLDFFDLNFVWLANVTYFIALVNFIDRDETTYRVGMTLAITSIIIAASMFLYETDLNVGYYVWLLSMIVILFGFVLKFRNFLQLKKASNLAGKSNALKVIRDDIKRLIKIIYKYVAAAVILVSGYYFYVYIYYHEHVNPNPKYFLTVKGSLERNIQLTNMYIQITYMTSNSRCETSPSFFGDLIEGVSSPRYIEKTYHLKFNAKGQVNNKIPLDLYDRGFCGWHIGFIEFNVGEQFLQKMIYELNENKPSTEPGKIVNVWVCKGNYCELSFPKIEEHAPNIDFNNYTYLFKVKNASKE